MVLQLGMHCNLNCLCIAYLGMCCVKPKFHYADFATSTNTSPQGKSRTQIMKVCDTNHVADFHDLCPQQSSQTLSPTFPVYYNGLNSTRATQTGLLWTFHGLRPKHLDMSRWFVSAIFMICVHNFPVGKFW